MTSDQFYSGYQCVSFGYLWLNVPGKPRMMRQKVRKAEMTYWAFNKNRARTYKCVFFFSSILAQTKEWGKINLNNCTPPHCIPVFSVKSCYKLWIEKQGQGFVEDKSFSLCRFYNEGGGGGKNAAVLWLISRSEANLVVFRARERQLTGRSSRRRIRFLLWSRRWSAPVHFLRLRNKMSTPVETPRVGALICSPHSVWCEKSELIPLDDTWKRLLWRWAEYVYAAKCYRIHMQVIWG